MANAKIAILMSTYNGEKYLAEQINSIIRQTYHDWHLYIRDDGSSDRTIEIIRKFAKKDKRMTLINDKYNDHENLGITRSFMSLLARSQADFYMFSDQDDYWLPSKVQVTLQKMYQQEYNIYPICVHTDLTIVDDHLKGSELMKQGKVWNDFCQLLFANCVTGCTMMINAKLKEMIDFKHINYHFVFLHDWWLALIAAAFGKLVYLDQATILYRQHGHNMVGSFHQDSFWQIIHRFMNPENEINQVKRTIAFAHEFSREYLSTLKGRPRVYVEKYGEVAYKGNFFRNLWLCMSFPPQRQNTKGNLFFSFLLIFRFKDFLKN